MGIVENLMDEAGISKDDAEWGLQYNLTHASIDKEFGVRFGLRQSIKDVIRSRYSWQTVGDRELWLPNP